ncbi:Uncharacterised protein [Escherichia coli]|uniref:Uncharacterized protein n=1 Tax=Escherichia coli TaxID=562 RepID=A0A377BM59_ECOLX|nr:Uncharacterised protein [Escherichia coli]
MRITLTMSTDIIHFRNFSISRIPARLLLPFSITASKGSIQRTAWQYVIEAGGSGTIIGCVSVPVSGCIALARKRYAYLSSPPATSAGTGRSQVFSRRRISRYSMTVFSVPGIDQRVKAVGVLCYLVKPIEVESLCSYHRRLQRVIIT